MVDKNLATRLGNAMAGFINRWIRKNCDGPIYAGTILSALLTHASQVLAAAPEEDRAKLFQESVIVLLSGADTAVAVSFHTADDVKDMLLDGVKTQGNA